MSEPPKNNLLRLPVRYQAPDKTPRWWTWPLALSSGAALMIAGALMLRGCQ